MAERARLAVLISGRGSNMEALARAAQAPDYPASIAVVIANRADAAGLGVARAMGLAAEVVPHVGAGGRAGFEAALEARLDAHGVELVALAGFMRVLSPAFVRRWEGRMLNIHPSLLPAFPGVDTHARALAAGCRVHGATVHFVTPDLDDGPIVAQAAVEVRDDDTAETLAARVLAQEHRILPEAVGLLAQARLSIHGRRVRRLPA
jgi:formyltetrahydrofolate-dependent phosphoribosylglycinamide formyltransferase